MAYAPPAQAQTVTSRQLVQHLLRRFAFSATPAQVTAVQAEGVNVWLAQQLNWTAIADSNTELDTLPTTDCPTPTPANNGGPTCDFDLYQRYALQHMMLTNRQVQAKLELHWLDLFSINDIDANFNHPALMWHYDNTVRANALGNYGTLLSAVSIEPEMLYWLSNNNNNAAAANVNFAREVMQLYTIGLNKLNDDGSLQLSATGQPIPTYTGADIDNIAKAISGYSVVITTTTPDNPLTDFSVSFIPSWHYSGPLSILGGTYVVPNNANALPFIINILVHQPSCAPFMVKQMLQRFVTENPSPQYIARVVAVWRQNANSPNQIAQVVRAIITDPDFNAAYHSMPKQPVEFWIDALRIIPNTQTANYASYNNDGIGEGILNFTSALDQELYNPPNVFSFYLPGHLEDLTNSSTLLQKQAVVTAALANYTGTLQLNVDGLRAQIGTVAAPATSGTVIGDYLLDAMVDGGSPTLAALVLQTLGSTPSDAAIESAIWLIMTSSEYAVN